MIATEQLVRRLSTALIVLVATICFNSTCRAVTQTDLNALKIMNYYPSANSWENMWTNWDANTIDSDLAQIAALNANTVRIIINTSAFTSQNQTDWTPPQGMLDELDSFINMASSHGLEVQLTLFDWLNSYGDINDNESWASAV